MDEESQTVVPLQWRPRAYQMPAWHALETGTRRMALVWHRRAGKDLFSINWCVTQCFERPGVYWHMLPTYRQGRKIVWEGKTRTGRDFLSHFPEQLITRKRDDEMSIWLEGGSLFQVVGGDDVDRLVGANPFGVVFSEFSLMDPRVWNLIRPILVENGGWALFIFTPRGRNHGYKLYQMAERNPKWFSQLLSVDDTKAVSTEAIEEERLAGMPEELIQQEFYCSFDAPLVGAYYGDVMTKLHQLGRLGPVPWEPNALVNTAWDLGIADALSIWFHQRVGKEERLIDFYQSSGVGLDHYAKVLREKPYVYGRHLVPHDAAVRELGTGTSRIEAARTLGLRLELVPKLPLADGINATRVFLSKCWIDGENCEYGIQALREYSKEETGERDHSGLPVYRDRPKHDWTSHPADAARTLAVAGYRLSPRREPERLAPILPIV